MLMSNWNKKWRASCRDKRENEMKKWTYWSHWRVKYAIWDTGRKRQLLSHLIRKQKWKERELGRAFKAWEASFTTISPFSSLCCVGKGPAGATNVNSLVKPLQWGLLHLPSPQLQGALFLPGTGRAWWLPQWDQTVQSSPAQGKPVIEPPAEYVKPREHPRRLYKKLQPWHNYSLTSSLFRVSWPRFPYISLWYLGLQPWLLWANGRERISPLASFRTYIAGWACHWIGIYE